jgi:hypothetical protein
VSPDAPFPVIALATTGLPRGDYKPAVVGIAFALVDPVSKKVSPSILHYIKQPAHVLDAPEAVTAARFHGISREVIERNGVSERDACDTFKSWREHAHEAVLEAGRPAMGPWRAYNTPFIVQILRGSALGFDAWRTALGGYGPPGRCIMDEASEVLGGEGLLLRNRNGTYRSPKLVDTVRWARRKRYKVPALALGPGGVVASAGAVALALRAERPAPVVTITSYRRRSHVDALLQATNDMDPDAAILDNGPWDE